MGIQPISHYPWDPQSTIRGNLAIGQLRENLIIRLREQLNGFRRYCAENGQPSPAVPENGIHASTALCMVGALTGFAAQNAALGRAAAHSANGEPLPDSSLLMFLPSSGERFLVGNWPNAHIFQERDSSIPLIMLAGGATQQAGFKPADLPDFHEMARHIATTVGTGQFGQVRTSAAYAPIWTPANLLQLFWPLTREVMRLPLPKGVTEEPPLDEAHWPIVISVVAQQLMKRTQAIVPPPIAFAIVMEAAIITAKVDPETYEPGKWQFDVAPGPKAVRQILVRRLIA